MDALQSIIDQISKKNDQHTKSI